MTFRFIYTNSNGGIVIYGSDFGSWVFSFLLDLIRESKDRRSFVRDSEGLPREIRGNQETGAIHHS